ncbi:MAG: RNA chaperone Hfq [Armatimonadota bacterium]
MANKKGNVQDAYLERMRKKSTRIRVVLLDGKKLTGVVKAYDAFTLILTVDPGGADVLIYKSAIAVIGPAKMGAQ